MRNRPALAAFVSLIVLALVAPASAGAGNVDPVKTTKKSESLPAPGSSPSHDYFAWSQPVNGRDQVFLETDGGPKQQISTAIYGFAGGFAHDRDELIYQDLHRSGSGIDSGLKMYDAAVGQFLALPAAINTSGWEWSPSYDVDPSDGQWFLYGENQFGSANAPWRVFVYDLAGAKRMLMGATTFRCGCIQPGTIAYPWVSWSKGPSGNVWRRNLETDDVEKLTVPGDRDEHAIAVTADGTAYVAQDGTRCGSNSKLYRVDPDGTTTRLATLPGGTEAYSLSTLDTATGVDLYFDRYACSNERFDIFKIADANTAERVVTPRFVGAGGSGAVDGALPPGAVPPAR